jgi:HEAT repeat protein
VADGTLSVAGALDALEAVGMGRQEGLDILAQHLDPETDLTGPLGELAALVPERDRFAAIGAGLLERAKGPAFARALAALDGHGCDRDWIAAFGTSPRVRAVAQDAGLAKLLRDSMSHQDGRAGKALIALGDHPSPAASAAAVRVLEPPFELHGHAVRALAVVVLGRIGDNAAIEPLFRWVARSDHSNPDRDRALFQAIRQACGGDLPTLMRAVTTRNLTQPALDAIVALGPEVAGPALFRLAMGHVPEGGAPAYATAAPWQALRTLIAQGWLDRRLTFQALASPEVGVRVGAIETMGPLLADPAVVERLFAIATTPPADSEFPTHLEAEAALVVLGKSQDPVIHRRLLAFGGTVTAEATTALEAELAIYRREADLGNGGGYEHPEAQRWHRLKEFWTHLATAIVNALGRPDGPGRSDPAVLVFLTATLDARPRPHDQVVRALAGRAEPAALDALIREFGGKGDQRCTEDIHRCFAETSPLAADPGHIDRLLTADVQKRPNYKALGMRLAAIGTPKALGVALGHWDTFGAGLDPSGYHWGDGWDLRAAMGAAWPTPEGRRAICLPLAEEVLPCPLPTEKPGNDPKMATLLEGALAAGDRGLFLDLAERAILAGGEWRGPDWRKGDRHAYTNASKLPKVLVAAAEGLATLGEAGLPLLATLVAHHAQPAHDRPGALATYHSEALLRLVARDLGKRTVPEAAFPLSRQLLAALGPACYGLNRALEAIGAGVTEGEACALAASPFPSVRIGFCEWAEAGDKERLASPMVAAALERLAQDPDTHVAWRSVRTLGVDTL